VHPGINRVYWDLRYPPPKLIELRATPATNPHVWNDLRFLGKESRPITHWGIEEAQVGPMVAPGTYTVRVTMDGKTYTRSFTVLADPSSPEAPAQTAARVKMLLHVRNDISSVSRMVNQIEWLRKQLQTVEAMLKAGKKPGHRTTLLAIKGMDRKIEDVEDQLLSPALANSDEKSYLAPYGVYLDLMCPATSRREAARCAGAVPHPDAAGPAAIRSDADSLQHLSAGGTSRRQFARSVARLDGNCGTAIAAEAPLARVHDAVHCR
jgi:hypothetical protein